MPRFAKGPDGGVHQFPDDATDAEISSALDAIPSANAASVPKAKMWTALTLAGGNAALSPAAQTAVADFATNPNAWKTAKAIGEVVGGATGLANAGPIGAAGGMYVGGKVGWRLSNAAQRIAAPVASVMEKVAPYSQTLGTLSGAQGVLDLSQMADPNRKDIQILGVGDPKDPNHPALLNLLAANAPKAVVQYLVGQGWPLYDATRTIYNLVVKGGK